MSSPAGNDMKTGQDRKRPHSNTGSSASASDEPVAKVQRLLGAEGEAHNTVAPSTSASDTPADTQTELGIISALVANIDRKMVVDNTALIDRIRNVCKEMVEHSKEPMRSLAAGSRHVPNESLVKWFQDVMPCLNTPSYTQRLMTLTDVEQASFCLLHKLHIQEEDAPAWVSFPNEYREDIHATLAEMYKPYNDSMLDDCARIVINSNNYDDVMFCNDLIVDAADPERYLSCGMLMTMVRNGYLDFSFINCAYGKVTRAVLDAFSLYHPESASEAQEARSMIPREFLQRLNEWRAEMRVAQTLTDIIQDKFHILDAYKQSSHWDLNALIDKFFLNHTDDNLTNPERVSDVSSQAPLVELIPGLHFSLLFDEDWLSAKSPKHVNRPTHEIRTVAVEEWRYKHAGKFTTLTKALIVLIADNRLNNDDRYRREIRWMVTALCNSNSGFSGYGNVARIIMTAAACVGDLQTYATALFYNGEDLWPGVEHIAVPLCHAAYCGQTWFVRALLHLRYRDDAVLCGAMQRGMVFDTNSFFTGTRISADIVRVPRDPVLNRDDLPTSYGKNFFKAAFSDALGRYNPIPGVVTSDRNKLAHVLGTQQPRDGTPLSIVMHLLIVVAQRGLHGVLQVATDLLSPLRELTWQVRNNYYAVTKYWQRFLEPYMRSMGSNFSAETLAAWHGELMHASLASGSQKTLVTAGELLLPFSRECFTSIICHVASDAAVAGAMSGVPHLRDRLRLLVESISSITMRLAMVRSQSDWCRLAPHLRRYLDLARSTAEKLEHQTTEAHRGAYFWLIWSMICGGGSAITNTPPPFTMADLLAPKRLVCCCGSRRGRRCYSAEILSILVGLADLRWNDILTMLNGHVVQRYRRHCTTVANATNTQPGVQDGNAVLTMQRSILQHIIRFNSCPNMLEALIGSRSPPAVYEAVLQRSLQTVPGIAEHGVAMTFHPTEDILMLLGKSRVPLPLRLKDRQVIYSESTDVALYALGNRNPANWQMSAEMTSRFLRVQNLLHAELNAHIPVSGLTDIVLDYMTDR